MHGLAMTVGTILFQSPADFGAHSSARRLVKRVIKSSLGPFRVRTRRNRTRAGGVGSLYAKNRSSSDFEAIEVLIKIILIHVAWRV